MKENEATDVVRLLAAGFHRENLEPETVILWTELLEPIDAQVATDVALEWVKQEDRFPSISQFRHACHLKAKRDKPPELSAAIATDDRGLPLMTARPEWVMRWTRARAAGDMRVFEEQIFEGRRYADEPRYSREGAEAIGLMPDDAWAS